MDDFRIEQALLFAADWLRRTGHNPGKPVFLHSLRVARACEALGCGEETVLTALLHDLIEDSDCRASDIEAAFGPSIARAVLALTDDAAIEDRLRRSLDSIARCAALGSGALAVRCLDAADNCRFFHLADKATQSYLIEKYRRLCAACAPFASLAPAREALLRQMRAQGIAPEQPS